MTPHDKIKDGFGHRIAGAHVGCVMRGGIHCFSLYLKDGEGMSETNLTILTELATMLGTVRGAWIVGGDWNMPPAALTASNWPTMVGGLIQAPKEATCNGKTYDYFVASSNLSTAVVHTARIDDSGLTPHSPARLYMNGGSRHKAVRRLIRPTAAPGLLPHGPSPQPRELTVQEAQNLSDLRRETNVDCARLAQAFSSWYSRAREVWRSLASSTDTTDEHKFRWEPATGRIAAGQQGATRISADLRAMSCRAQEIAALVKKGLRPRMAGLRRSA